MVDEQSPGTPADHPKGRTSCPHDHTLVRVATNSYDVLDSAGGEVAEIVRHPARQRGGWMVRMGHKQFVTDNGVIGVEFRSRCEAAEVAVLFANGEMPSQWRTTAPEQPLPADGS